MLGKHISPLKCVSGRAQRFNPRSISLISTMIGPTSQRKPSTRLRPRSSVRASSNSDACSITAAFSFLSCSILHFTGSVAPVRKNFRCAATISWICSFVYDILFVLLCPTLRSFVACMGLPALRAFCPSGTAQGKCFINIRHYTRRLCPSDG